MMFLMRTDLLHVLLILFILRFVLINTFAMFMTFLSLEIDDVANYEYTNVGKRRMLNCWSLIYFLTKKEYFNYLKSLLCQSVVLYL